MVETRSGEVFDERKTLATDPVMLLSKLAWEIESIRKSPNTEMAERIFISINAASTAWHLHEWIWKLASDGERDRLVSTFQLEVRGAKAFGLACRKHSIALEVCRQMSIAAKHVTVGYNRDDIYCQVSRTMRGDKIQTSVMLHFDGRALEDADIYEAALNWWCELYLQMGFDRSGDLAKVLAAHQ